MKITVNRKAFSDTLAEVMPFINKKAALDILKYAKITTKGNRLKIEANDQQCGIVKYIEVIDSDQDGSFLIPMEDVTKFFSKLDGENVQISYDDNQVKVKYNKGTADFPSSPEKEYPSFNMRDEESTEIEVPSAVLKDFISKGKNFVSDEPIRPIMTVIYAYLKDGHFGFCSSDTHVLAWGQVPYETDKETSFFIMPGVFNALIKASSFSEKVIIKFTETHAQYRLGNTIIQTVQVKGKYPNFERVIPKDNTIECSVEKDDLIKTLQRVCMFASSASGLVKLDFTRMDMNVSAENLDLGKQANENITHNGCGGEIQIGVQGEYFMKILSVFPNGEVLLKMSDPARPILVEQAEMPDFKTIIMPMMIV